MDGMERSPETRLFRAYWGDGTLDLSAGGAVVAIGLGYVFHLFLVEAVVVPLAFATWFVLRRRVVGPRSGYVVFSRARRERSAAELIGAGALGVGFLLLAVAIWMHGAPGLNEGVDALPALLMALASVVAAGLTRARRFVAYGGVWAAAGGMTLVTSAGPAMPLLAGGLVMCVGGAVMLTRFIHGSRRFEGEE
jgi:hypothetical protein